MALTNESLASLIQEDNAELKPILWERIKKLLYSYADKYYQDYSDYCRKSGVEVWDLKQQAYIAYDKSLTGFDSSRGLFSNYVLYIFRQAIRAITGRKDPLNASESIDRNINEDSETTLTELIPDDTAAELFEAVDESTAAAVVREAVERLPDRERNIITAEYFHGKTQTDIAADIGVTPERVRQLRKGAFRQLKADRAIKKLADELGYNSYRAASNTLGSFKRTGISGVELVAIERADISMRLSYYDKREEAENLLLNGGTFEEYEKAIARLQLAE